MSLDYLSKYLNKDTEKSKKRKRTTTRIVEDDLTGWGNGATLLDDAQAEKPVIVREVVGAVKGAGFKPAYIKQEETAANAEPAKAESTGLLTKAQIAAEIKARREAEAHVDKTESRDRGPQETVYRDATGRRIDIALAKQEKAREKKREEERRRKEQELGRGLVQQREREARENRLAEVQREGFSRYAGDREAETSLRQKRQWNDPAAQFLSNTTTQETGRPLYKEGFAPNRFGIRPGYRWDGVDRGNGFEAKRFKAIAALNQRKSEYDDWAREDM